MRVLRFWNKVDYDSYEKAMEDGAYEEVTFPDAHYDKTAVLLTARAVAKKLTGDDRFIACHELVYEPREVF